MKNKKLKRLSRRELLELLLEQTEQTELLQEQVQQLQQQLADRNLKLQQTGDLAHAVLEINGVMEAAQAAAQQYMDSIAAMEAETKIQCEQMLKAEARKILGVDPAEEEPEDKPLEENDSGD